MITSSGHSNAMRKAGPIWPLQIYKLKHMALGTGGGRGGEQMKDGGRVSRGENFNKDCSIDSLTFPSSLPF